MTVGRQRLHPDGPELSRLVWGAWRAVKSTETDTPVKLARLIAGCLELDVTSFDLADIYGGYQTDALFGAALREWGGDRGRLELVTKCGIGLVGPARPAHRVKHYDSSAAHIRASLESSLRLLGTDYVDLLLLHRPDPLMDADETADALARLVQEGKARAVGVSNHTPAQIELLQSRLPVPLATNQIELSLLHTAPLLDGTLDHAQRQRMAPMAWSPLGGGSLFGPERPHVGTALERLAREHGVDRGLIALAWLLRLPSRPLPVLGTTRFDRLSSLVRAESVVLDRQSWFELYEASLGHAVP
jgi:predicted oxidoreductase